MATKKDKKMQSKKRKLEAFLDLISVNNSETQNGEPEKKKLAIEEKMDSSSTESSREDETPEEKKFLKGSDLVEKEISKDSATSTKMSAEELKELRKKIKERQKASMEQPKFFISLEDQDLACFPKNGKGQPILYLADVQHLVLRATLGQNASYTPRWCKIIRPQKISSVVFAIVDSASVQDFEKNINCFPFIKETFQPLESSSMEFVSPSQYGGSVEGELFLVPMSSRKLQMQFHDNGFGNFEKLNFNINKCNTTSTTTTSSSNNNFANRIKGQFFRANKLDLMLDTEEMKMEGYTLPVDDNPAAKNFVYSKESYKLPTRASPLLAVDCEMVETTKSTSEVAWVSVVNEKLECVYETLVKPRHPVVDYRTRFSGITEELLEDVTTTLADVQKELCKILPSDAILVGQSLNFDLNALKMFHPFVIDTSVIFNLSGYKQKKSKLQFLAKLFLKRDIQNHSSKGHNPREDAEAAMQLVLLKLKNGYNFGNVLEGWKVDDLVADRRRDDNDDYGKDPVVDGNDGSQEKRLVQKSAFFRSNKHSNGLFGLVAKEKKTISLVDLVNCSASGDNITVVNSSAPTEEEEESAAPDVCRDSRTFKACRNVVRSNSSYFTVVQFTDLKESISSCDVDGRSGGGKMSCERCLKTALHASDRRLKKIYNSMPAKSVFIVLFTGRASGSHGAQNGICFVKIKTE